MQTELPPPPLKRTFRKTETKSFLTERMKKDHPTFRFLTYATGVFHFQRMKAFRDFDLKEALHIVFSVSDNTMHASVSSRLNPIHTLAPVYNKGLINPHVDLGALRDGNDIFPSSNTAYSFNGTRDGMIAMIDQMLVDFTNIGIPYIENRWADLKNNPMVNEGIDIIDSWDFDKTMLRNELTLQYRKAKLRVTSLRHPLYNDVKEQLMAIRDQPTEAYNEIPRLAFELMELYCSSRIIS